MASAGTRSSAPMSMSLVLTGVNFPAKKSLTLSVNYVYHTATVNIVYHKGEANDTSNHRLASSDETVSEGPRQSLDRVAANQVKHVPAGTGPAYWGPGELMTFLITGEETGGAFFMAEISVAPGGGTPPHIHHREDESFHMLEGTLTIQVGGDTITASAGDFAFLPRGIAHSFKNTGDGLRRRWY